MQSALITRANKKKQLMWAFVNDSWIEADKASLHVSDLAVQRGYGVFDFFRTAENIPLFIDQHIERLNRSASVLRCSTGWRLSYARTAMKS